MKLGLGFIIRKIWEKEQKFQLTHSINTLIICFAFYATLNQMLELLQFSVLLKKNFVRIRNDTCEKCKVFENYKIFSAYCE